MESSSIQYRVRMWLTDWLGDQCSRPGGPQQKHLAHVAEVREVLLGDTTALTDDQYLALQSRIEGDEDQVWSEADSPSEWQRKLKISGSTWRRYVRSGALVVKTVTTKKVHIRLDCLRAYLPR